MIQRGRNFIANIGDIRDPVFQINSLQRRELEDLNCVMLTIHDKLRREDAAHARARVIANRRNDDPGCLRVRRAVIAERPRADTRPDPLTDRRRHPIVWPSPSALLVLPDHIGEQVMYIHESVVSFELCSPRSCARIRRIRRIRRPWRPSRQGEKPIRFRRFATHRRRDSAYTPCSV